MKNRKKILNIALSKMYHFYKKQWVACLTPIEALALLDDGAKEHGSYCYSRKYVENKVRCGESGLMWFYFYPTYEQIEQYHKRRVRHEKDN